MGKKLTWGAQGAKEFFPRGECGKISYDKRTAQTLRNKLIRDGKQVSLFIYQCEKCNAWHLTHQGFHKGEANLEKYEYDRKVRRHK